jgi:hypothetical protein
MAVSNTYSAKEIKKLMLISFKKYQRGTISETQAYRENTMLANILRAIESSEQEARLEALEQAILKTRND